MLCTEEYFWEEMKKIHKTFKGAKAQERLRNPGLGFPGGAVVRSPPANAGDTGSSPGPGGSHMPRSK